MEAGTDVRGFREAGHRLIDPFAGYLEEAEDGPLFPDAPPHELFGSLAEKCPRVVATLLVPDPECSCG